MTKRKTPNQRKRTLCDIEAFNVYAKHINKYESLPGKLASHFAKHALSMTHLRILDIGCGPGQLTIPLLEELFDLLPTLRSVDYTGVDCSIKALESLRNDIQSLASSPYHILDVKLLHCKVEDVISRKEISGSFDLILCSHVLYYIPRWRWMIRRIYNLLEPSGDVCVILTASYQTLSALKDIAKTYDLSWFKSEPSSITFLNWLSFSGYKYVNQTHDSTLSVAKLAKNDITKAIEILAQCLSFLTGSYNSSELHDATRNLINIGYTDFPLKETLFWISKNRK